MQGLFICCTYDGADKEVLVPWRVTFWIRRRKGSTLYFHMWEPHGLSITSCGPFSHWRVSLASLPAAQESWMWVCFWSSPPSLSWDSKVHLPHQAWPFLFCKDGSASLDFLHLLKTFRVISSISAKTLRLVIGIVLDPQASLEMAAILALAALRAQVSVYLVLQCSLTTVIVFNPLLHLFC